LELLRQEFSRVHGIDADIEGDVLTDRDRINQEALKHDRKQRIDQDGHHDERDNRAPIAEDFAQFFQHESLQSAKKRAARRWHLMQSCCVAHDRLLHNAVGGISDAEDA
jgi:hypothetical protein